MYVGVEQALVVVLAVEIYELLAQLRQGGHGNRAALYKGFVFAFAVQFAPLGKLVSR